VTDGVGADPQRVGILLGSWPLGMPQEPEFYPEVARQVDTGGYDLLFVGDHLFAAGPNPDALTLLGGLATATRQVVLGTAILLLPLRDPVVAAKQVATVDLLSNGRLILGVGVGGEFAAEWAAAGVPTEGRGRRLDEYLALMRALWSGEPVEHPGPLRPVSGVRGSPPPVQPGGPPIWVGGRSDAALARAARHEGWCAYASSPRRVRANLERIGELRGGLTGFRTAAVVFTVVDRDEAAARDRAARVLGTRYGQDFDRFVDAFCAVGSPGRVGERLAEFRQAGVQDLLLCPQVPAEEFREQIDALSGVLGA
jgi:alkanesulfonate monooxygenase SsuD/methylene tetrahydromethanopterin reductase-like flavin-dependent oxidoreductase (luciferase family)